MTRGGLSGARLARMHDVMARHVDGGEVPGLVTLISRHGEVHVDAIGTKAVGDGDPMRRDTIFRITSMTKPMTAVATMILVEECKLRLDEPVDRWLPELADRRVLKRLDGPLDDTVPARRPITVRDLLTFRMGFGVIMTPSDDYPIQKAVNEHRLCTGPPKPATPHAPDEWMRRLGTLPLMHQPGEKWMYNTGSHVLGVLIARVAEQPLETFFRERIFEPLGMKDTGFSVPAGKLDRLATSYWVDTGHGRARAPRRRRGQPVEPSARVSGCGRGTGVDGRRLPRLRRACCSHKGRHGRERILSRLSVEAMTTDQLTPAQKAATDFAPGYWDGHGWGFGVSVVTRRDDLSAVPGRFGWDGGYGTSWASDPAEDVVAILMTQRAAFPRLSGVYLDFWTSTYQAIDD